MSNKKKSDAEKDAPIKEEQKAKQSNDSTQTKEDKSKSESVDIKVGPTVAPRSAGARKRKEEEVDPGEQIASALGRTQRFFYENGKVLLGILAAIFLIVAGILGYNHIYLASKNDDAGKMMFVAEQLFMEESFELALNGDGNNPGFLDVIDKYGATRRGNIARHYAGVSYFQLGELDDALKYLEKYKSTKGAPNQIINAQNQGLQADIYVQKGELDKAISKYEKAIKESDNNLTTPVYLKKLGMVYNKIGKHKESEEAFTRILNEYPMSLEARDIEKYIGEQQQK